MWIRISQLHCEICNGLLLPNCYILDVLLHDNRAIAHKLSHTHFCMAKNEQNVLMCNGGKKIETVLYSLHDSFF